LTRECQEDFVKDDLEHGGSHDVEFWNFISDGFNNIFTVFEIKSLSIYIVLVHIDKITGITNKLSMSEITELQKMLEDIFICFNLHSNFTNKYCII